MTNTSFANSRETAPSNAALSDAQIDHDAFRSAMGRYASGITVVAGHDGVEPIGFTCQSFYSVSLTPPLVSFSVMRTSSTYPRIRETGRFSVNVLEHKQSDISNQFARRGTDKWAGVEWNLSENSTPIIGGAIMWLECDIESEYEAGDHFIVVGRVNDMQFSKSANGEPLVYFDGRYHTLREMRASSR